MGDALRKAEPASIPEVWLSSEEAARLLDVTSRTMINNSGRYVTRQMVREGTGGIRHEFLLSSLPIEALTRWENHRHVQTIVPPSESDLTIAAYDRADSRTRKFFDRWIQVLLATETIAGRKNLEAWVARWNLTHDDHPISVQSLYRVRAQVRDHGRISLLQRETKLPESSVRDEWFADFCLAYLNENKLSISRAHMATFGLAKEAADESGKPFDPLAFPSEKSFMRRLEKEVPPAIIALKRNGEKKFFDDHGFYVERDYSDLVSGRIWVGDSRVQDFMVRVDGVANPIRPWLTLFICMKSYVPMGWYLHASAPSAENTMRALRHGIVRMGRPEWLYLDNGREYRNKEVTGLSRGRRVNYDLQHTGSLAAQIGIKVHFAEVHRSRAKVIEMQFKNMKGIIDRFWPTFCGGNSIEKPNRLKEILAKGTDLPTLEEVRLEFNEYCEQTIPHVACQGKTHKGRTRAQVLQEDYAKHGPLPMVSADTAAMLVTKLATGTIGRRGFHLNELDATWWAEWMPSHKGRKVVLRYDPDDLKTARCYEATEQGHGKLIGSCMLIMAAGAMVREDDECGLAEVARQNKIFKLEVKQGLERFPQATGEDLKRLRRGFKRGVESRQMSLETSNTTLITGHDESATQLRRESKSGRADLSVLLEPELPKQEPREWIWLEGQIAAG